MRDEKRLIFLLTGIVTTIFSLTAALAWSLQWSMLSITTLLFCLTYPLLWLAWRIYDFWCQSIRQLTSYTQMLKEGEHNIRFTSQHPRSLLSTLQKEIAQLAQTNEKNVDQSIDSILIDIFDTWSLPICLFDENLKLLYRNQSMNEKLKQPMLLGQNAKSLGFTFDQYKLKNSAFTDSWQCQSIHFNHLNKSYYFFAAINSSVLINQKQNITKQNLIRVLSHELRNSLTPLSSMTDTLLANDKLDEAQTRHALTRINLRSKRLLGFISEYNQLAQLPKPHATWHEFKDIVDDAKLTISKEIANVNYLGAKQCYGDAAQIAQVLINLMKNACEANSPNFTEIDISLYIENKQQYIECKDNGPGFANLDNVLTPFYTTKPNGSGIGLSLCAEIVNNHYGRIEVSNLSVGGAKIVISWPIDSQ